MTAHAANPVPQDVCVWHMLLAPGTAPPLPVTDPAQVPPGLRILLGLDARPWRCGSLDGRRWVLWTIDAGDAPHPVRVRGYLRTWPTAVAARAYAARHGYLVAASGAPAPPSLRRQVSPRFKRRR